MFSIIIPTWNNLNYLKLCVESIRKNSVFSHQVILHVNDGSDGTLQWARQQELEHTYSAENKGICMAVNSAATLARNEFIVYMNDDMYCCHGWDRYLMDEIKMLPDRNFMLSATMIEPKYTGNKAVIVADFGGSYDTFKEKELIERLSSLKKNDWSGSSWPPCVVSKQNWDIVGGFSIEFSPGMGSDDDFSMKLWRAGCRYFKGIGNSLVYHFQQKSTSRVHRNDGSKQFLFKWGINSSVFNRHFLKRGEDFKGPLAEPSPAILRKAKIRAWLKKKFIY